jgi:hypothetical protein
MKKKILRWLGLYTEADLVSFGKYVLSDKRCMTITFGFEDRIHDADLANWKEDGK